MNMLSSLPNILNIFGGTAAIAALTGSIELAAITAAALLPSRRVPGASVGLPRTAIVVPAHNEECGIAKTLANLQSEIDGDPSAQVFVIADNCTDATARVAHEAGATVIERHDPNLRGKGYALNFAFGRILERGFEAVIVIDAWTPERLRSCAPGSLRSRMRSRPATWWPIRAAACAHAS
jgi:cellulose synthase/poly-beta-1,6-N-acetylglucosamine synthase-like glycosyltransferase